MQRKQEDQEVNQIVRTWSIWGLEVNGRSWTATHCFAKKCAKGSKQHRKRPVMALNVCVDWFYIALCASGIERRKKTASICSEVCISLPQSGKISLYLHVQYSRFKGISFFLIFCLAFVHFGSLWLHFISAPRRSWKIYYIDCIVKLLVFSCNSV